MEKDGDFSFGLSSHSFELDGESVISSSIRSNLWSIIWQDSTFQRVKLLSALSTQRGLSKPVPSMEPLCNLYALEDQWSYTSYETLLLEGLIWDPTRVVKTLVGAALQFWGLGTGVFGVAPSCGT